MEPQRSRQPNRGFCESRVHVAAGRYSDSSMNALTRPPSVNLFCRIIWQHLPVHANRMYYITFCVAICYPKSQVSGWLIRSWSTSGNTKRLSQWRLLVRPTSPTVLHLATWRYCGDGWRNITTRAVVVWGLKKFNNNEWRRDLQKEIVSPMQKAS